ncbi:Hypothetical protein PHPALM_19876 [Phytophthora palmivora]|uniref:Secreted protein n=1 Tax=Phytophthora palmivora TaxID=4796 RepID=A0A2P4XGA1_9STRA|nr:Hypothetical protein PHPALM_19876 [Phytophthora palmivora]
MPGCLWRWPLRFPCSLILSMPWGSLRGNPTTSSITFTAHALLFGTRSRRRVNRCARRAGRPQLCENTIRVNQIQFRLSGVETCLGLEHLLLVPAVVLCADAYSL